MIKKGLIEIVTKTDTDGLLFFRRNDTGQTIHASDLHVLKNMRLDSPLSNDSIKKGRIYLPSASVPDRANAVAFVTERLEGERFLHGAYFSQLDLREDDDIRTLAENEMGSTPLYGSIHFEIYF